MKIKLYCIFSEESVSKMNGIRGKMCSQAGHAYLHAYWNAVQSDDESIRQQAYDYQDSDHAYKITLITKTDQELFNLIESYKGVCGVTVVEDAGFTVFKGKTLTCVGIGPIREDLVKDDLKTLKLFT